MASRHGLLYRWHRFLRRYVCSRLGHKWRSTGSMTYCRRCHFSG